MMAVKDEPDSDELHMTLWSFLSSDQSKFKNLPAKGEKIHGG